MFEQEAEELIREVCHQHKEHPEEIVEVLHEHGITPTLGQIHHALAEEEANWHGHEGLTAEDLVTAGELASRAGGFDRLIRVLEAMRDAPR